MIGFTGARVIEQTLKVKLPEGFQEAEFLMAHGQIDKVVPRKEMRATLARLLEYMKGALQGTGQPRGKRAEPTAEKPAAPEATVPETPAKPRRPRAPRKRAAPRPAPRRRN